MTAVGRREEEARAIARAEHIAIAEANEDWTFFTLDDGQPIGPDGVDGRGFLAGRTIHTHFEWVEDRFEGFVS